jgi:60 kDa SS-A/Ro ribonucleoprotein
MSRVNVKASPVLRKRSQAEAEKQLMRLLATCMLWEDGFSLDGQTIADLLIELVPQCRPAFVAAAAVYTRSTANLRHAPLLVVREMLCHAEHRALVGKLLPDVIQRPDEIAEFVALYWSNSDNKHMLPKQAKIGLAAAFNKFSEHSLSKWDKAGAVRLRDVLFLVHAKPVDGKSGRTAAWRKERLAKGGLSALGEKEALFNKIAQDELVMPDTHEKLLSAGADPKATWEALMLSKELGALAFLRNLRNMDKVGVDRGLIKQYSQEIRLDRILPYRYIAAARVVPQYEDILEGMMFRSLEGQTKVPGRTAVLLDISPSMQKVLSEKSDMTRRDAALGLGILCREVFEDVACFAVSNDCVETAPRRGFALGEALYAATPSNGTKLGYAVRKVNAMGFDRVIMLTDEESQDTVPLATAPKAYMVNVASNRRGVGFGSWVSISGFSEAVLDYILLLEKEEVTG